MRIAEIVTIGDELLSGETIDTNANFIDGMLEQVGYQIARHTTVADDEDAIAKALNEAAQRVSLVIASGGLGPTSDDRTMAALARALGCGMRVDRPTLVALHRRAEALGRSVNLSSERMALVAEVGEPLPNGAGSAPGFRAQLGGAEIYLVPGVPRECRWLLENAIVPRLGVAEAATLRRTLKTLGIAESRLEDSVRGLYSAHPSVRFGYRTLGIENHIKLAASGAGAGAALQGAESAIRALLGPWIFGADTDSLASVVGTVLLERRATIATAESCTGGWVTKLLTDGGGASAFVLGGAIVYADKAKAALLGVREETLAAHGAVSVETAQEMALGVQIRFGADWGLSLTGIAGPEGGTAEKPVGTVFIGIAGPDSVQAHRTFLPGEREEVRANAAKWALELLRRSILGLPLQKG